MHKFFLALYLLISSLNFSHSQNKVTEVTYQRIINLNNPPEQYTAKQKQFINNRYKNYDLLSYTLLFNKNESLFFLSDSISGLFHDIEDNSLKKIILNEGEKKYYKNINEKKILYQTISGGEKLLIKRELNQIKWKLLNETKQIDRYNCFKAQLIYSNELLGYNKNMVIEAWYTPEISIPFGPIHFEGLPGLILELELGRNVYYVTSIKFNSNNIIQPLTEEEKVITQEAYSTYLKDFIEQISKN